MQLHDVREALSVHAADISRSSFTNTSLAESRFDDVDLRGTALTNANLTGLICRDVNLSGASISDAKLTGMTIDGILVDELLRVYRGGNRATDATSPMAARAVLYAKSLQRLRDFYQHALGFAVKSASHDHAVLASAALDLVIVAMPEAIASSVMIDVPPQLRTEVPTKLVFATSSIGAARAAARAHGGDVLPPEKEWEYDGHRVCDGNDPEGNIFQLRELRG
jgi:predicted enzyme related to lactoylglutathione lyase